MFGMTQYWDRQTDGQRPLAVNNSALICTVCRKTSSFSPDRRSSIIMRNMKKNIPRRQYFDQMPSVMI